MNSDQIDKLNARVPSAEELPDLTDSDIGNLDSTPLRAWAIAAELEDRDLFDTVASLPIDETVINTTGALSGMEEYLSILKKAYRDREPRVVHRYRSIELQVYTLDDTLRGRLMCARDYARGKRESE